jgi:hypothetical protein
MLCALCSVSSKDVDVVERKKTPGTNAKTKWGKTTTRKLKSRSGRKVKVKRRCGEVCRYCNNNLKRWQKMKKYKNLFKKHGRRACTQAMRDDLNEDTTLRARFKGDVEESKHLLMGGRSRIRKQPERIDRVQEAELEEIAEAGKFVELPRYKAKFGDPKKNGAVVVTHRLWGKGVYVMDNTDGEHAVRRVIRDKVQRTAKVHDGTEILDEDELDDVAAAEGDEMIEGLGGALTLEETEKRAASARKQEVVQAEAVATKAAAEPAARDGTSSDGSSSSDSDGDKSGSDDDSAGASPPAKKKLKPSVASSSSAPLAKGSAAARASPRGKPDARVKIERSNSVPSNTRGAGRVSAARPAPPTVDGGALDAQATKLDAILGGVASGQFDLVRGRPLQALLREWNEVLIEARKIVKSGGDSAPQVAAQVLALDRAREFFRIAAKPGSTFSELSRSFDVVIATGFRVSSPQTLNVIMKNLDSCLANGDTIAGAHLMNASVDGPPYGLKLTAADQRESVCEQILAKIVANMCPAKPAVGVPIGEAVAHARGELAKLVSLEIRGLSEGAKRELSILKAVLNPSTADLDLLTAALVSRAVDSISEGERVVDVLSASKVGKLIMKAPCDLVATSKKDVVKNEAFRIELATISKWLAQESLETISVDSVKTMTSKIKDLVGSVHDLKFGGAEVFQGVHAWVQLARNAAFKMLCSKVGVTGTCFGNKTTLAVSFT